MSLQDRSRQFQPFQSRIHINAMSTTKSNPTLPQAWATFQGGLSWGIMQLTRASVLVRAALSFGAGLGGPLLFSPILVESSPSPPSSPSSSTAISTSTTDDDTVHTPLLLRAARGENVERTPVWMMRQAGRHMKAYRDLIEKYPTFRERSEIPEAALEISLQPFREYGVDGVILFSIILTPLPSMGVDFTISETGKISIQPIRTRQSFNKMLERMHENNKHDNKISDENGEQSTGGIMAKACPFVGQVLTSLRQQVGSDGTVLGFIGLPYTLATYLVEGQTGSTTGFQQVRALHENDPKLMHDILSLLATNLADYACYQIDSGAQIIQVFDSWAGHLNDQEYRSFALPYQQQVITSIKQRHPSVPIIIYMAPGEYSKDGKRLPFLAESGADIVSVDHTVEMSKAREIIPSNIGLQGNLDPRVLRDGPLEEIKIQTERIISQATTRMVQDDDDDGQDGTNPRRKQQHRQQRRPFIMNLGHGIDKATPEEHAAFFVQTVHNYKEHEQKQISKYDESITTASNAFQPFL